MKFDPQIHHRRSIRLRSYDYSQAGAYFVTICVEKKECLLGEIVNGEMNTNPLGEIVRFCWDDLPSHYPNVELDAFVVMPNHVHAIILLVDATDSVGAGLRPALSPDTEFPQPPANPVTSTKRHPLSEIVRAFKSFSARRVNELRGAQGTKIWQRDYYEHIIRTDRELERIREYIMLNPANWMRDDYNLRP